MLLPRRWTAPSAEFGTVSEAKQKLVDQGVRAALVVELAGRVPPGRQAAVNDLLARVGRPDFYMALAKYDLPNQTDWYEMMQVQYQFARVEPQYDAKTRAYSESMRLTLHATAVLHFALREADNGESLFERYIEAHPTAFHENGGWIDNLQIPVSGAVKAVETTPHAMWCKVTDLLQGALIVDEQTVKAAQFVRLARHAVLNYGQPTNAK